MVHYDNKMGYYQNLGKQIEEIYKNILGSPGKEKSIGVIVGRFQTPELTVAHLSLLKRAIENHSRVVVFIGVSSVKNSILNPLDFLSRYKMLNEEFPGVLEIYPINDTENDDIWTKSLDNFIDSLINPNQSAILYGGRDSFLNSYSGKYMKYYFSELPNISATDARAKCINYPSHNGASCIDHKMLRWGIINAAYQRYPTCYQVVDIALYDESDNSLFMIQKEGDNDNLFRFPGGFSDISSGSLEEDAKRELIEELGGEMQFEEPVYIGSAMVDDWRYRRERDKIKTAFFASKWIKGMPIASDDAYKVERIKISQLMERVRPTHANLAKKFLNWKS